MTWLYLLGFAASAIAVWRWDHRDDAPLHGAPEDTPIIYRASDHELWAVARSRWSGPSDRVSGWVP